MSGIFDGVLEGKDEVLGSIFQEEFSYSGGGSHRGFLSRDDLSHLCICGSMASRSRMAMEVVLREVEAGERHAILDLDGNYRPLIDYIPSLRIYEFGRFASVNPFKFFGDKEDAARTISTLVQSLYDLSRDERIYLERSLGMAYAERIIEPTLGDIGDRLLQIQADVQPKEAYKVECLKGVLWEMGRGRFGNMFRCKESELKFPAVLDLSNLGSSREKALTALCLLLREGSWGVTSVVVDPADRILRGKYFAQWELLAAFEETFDNISRCGTLLHLGSTSPLMLPRSIAEAASAYLFCGPMWERDLVSIEKTFALDHESFKSLRQLREGAALLCTWGKTAPIFLKPNPSNFREIQECEILEHMRILGEDPKDVAAEGLASEAKMLEKVFKDRAALVYAWEVLRLIKGGKVPVDAVTNQKNALLRAVVKSLKRYFMIVEYTDSTGMPWYRLTKVGERAVSEMEGAGDGEGTSDGELSFEGVESHSGDKELRK
jgi:hypothetical protein